jgi:DNA-damage-inducible protein J
MKTHNDVRITVRVDKELKENAEVLFDRFGMNMSTALNVFLRKVVAEKAIPFAIGAKNTEFGRAYSPDDITDAFGAAVQNDITENQQKGFPVARYDAASQRAYLESADGTRQYVHR